MRMEQAIKRILEAHGRLEDFQAGNAHARIENPGYMALSIERQGTRWIIEHNYTQNGDLMADPLMDFLAPEPDPFSAPWQARTYQQDGLGLYQDAFPVSEDGRQMIRPKLARELKSFSGQWAKNLINQGFAEIRAEEEVLQEIR